MTALQQNRRPEQAKSSKNAKIGGFAQGPGQECNGQEAERARRLVGHFDTAVGQFSASDRLDATCWYFALDLRRGAVVQL
jgi:hypothetical protein